MKESKFLEIDSSGRRKNHARRKKILFFGVFLAVLCVGAVIGTGMLMEFPKGSSPSSASLAQTNGKRKSKLPKVHEVTATPDPTSEENHEYYQLEGRTNILMMGVDSLRPGKEKDGKYYPRSDTMMILSLDTKTNSAFVLSVPRDIQVSVDGGQGKLNYMYRSGGPQRAMKAVEKITGIKLDKYLVLSYQAVEKTVRDLGGVEFFVPKNMHKDDPYATPPLKIRLRKGLQVLDGNKAMQLLRFRGYADGDLGRMHVQQEFMKALFKKALSPSSVVHIPSYIDTLMTFVETDMNILDMLTYVHYVQRINLDEIQKQTLIGEWDGSISRFVVDRQKAAKQIQYLLSGEYEKNDLSVAPAKKVKVSK